MIIAHKKYHVFRLEIFTLITEKFLYMDSRNVGEKVFKLFLFAIFVKNLVVHNCHNIKIERYSENGIHNSPVYSQGNSGNRNCNSATNFNSMRDKKIFKSYSKTSSLLKGYMFTKQKIIPCRSTRALLIHTMI